MRAKQTLTAVLVIAVVLVGLAVHTGIGTPSSWGIADVAALCPLGALETLVASKTMVPPLFIGLGIFAVVTVLFGRSFCGWGCPVPLVRRILGIKNSTQRSLAKEGKARKKSAENNEEQMAFGAKLNDSDAELEQALAASYTAELRDEEPFDVAPENRGGLKDTRFWVLGGMLVSSAVFGFPVFCLVCPVGLTFATIIVLWKVFELGTFTWSLLLYPAILILELSLMRKWCHKFCPIGALVSLVSRANISFRPCVDNTSCLKKTQGANCGLCAQVCPEGIDLHNRKASAPINECIRCKTCQSACPSKAISFPLFNTTEKRIDNDDKPNLETMHEDANAHTCKNNR